MKHEVEDHAAWLDLSLQRCEPAYRRHLRGLRPPLRMRGPQRLVDHGFRQSKVDDRDCQLPGSQRGYQNMIRGLWDKSLSKDSHFHVRSVNEEREREFCTWTAQVNYCTKTRPARKTKPIEPRSCPSGAWHSRADTCPGWDYLIRSSTSTILLHQQPRWCLSLWTIAIEQSPHGVIL